MLSSTFFIVVVNVSSIIIQLQAVIFVPGFMQYKLPAFSETYSTTKVAFERVA